MSEEQDRVRSQLFDLEMKGKITERQRGVVLNELAVLTNDAARRRDALEIVDLERLKTRLNAIPLSRPINILDYLKDIFIEGQRVLFTLFDLVGIILFLFPSVAQSIVSDIALTRLIGGAIFFASFLWANYSVYKRLS